MYEILKSDKDVFIQFLSQNYDIDWAEYAIQFLSKSYNLDQDYINKGTIEYEESGEDYHDGCVYSYAKKYFSLRLNNEKTKVTLAIEWLRNWSFDRKEFDEFIVNIENNKLNIYSRKKRFLLKNP